MWQLINRVCGAYKRHGLVRFIGLALYNIYHVAARGLGWTRKAPPADDFDTLFGTDTTTIREVGSLSVSSSNLKHAVRYQPSRAQLVESVLARLAIDFSRFVFVDLGSGKGKVLLVASHFPFRRIVGVEFSEELKKIADVNAERYKSARRKCDAIATHAGDAACFEFPDDPLVVYMYNPFGEAVMRRVVANLELSYARMPRPLRIIYVEPALRSLFDSSTVFRLDAEDENVAFYSATPEPFP